MGGKRFRWIYFQLGQLALLSVAAFVAAFTLAMPAGGGQTLQLSMLASADISIMIWIPSLVVWLLMKRKRKQRPLRLERELRVLRLGGGQPPERKAAIRARMRKRFEHLALRECREDRYERFSTSFVVVTSTVLVGFYAMFRDPVALKAKYPGFYVNAEFLLPIAVMTLALGVAVGAIFRNRTTFLVLFAGIGASSLHMLFVREWFMGPAAAWRDIGTITCRFTGIGAFAIGIAAGIFVRELLRYRRHELRRRKT